MIYAIVRDITESISVFNGRYISSHFSCLIIAAKSMRYIITSKVCFNEELASTLFHRGRNDMSVIDDWVGRERNGRGEREAEARGSLAPESKG